MTYVAGTRGAFQVCMDRRKFSGRSGNNETRDWREICEDVLRESSSERVNALLEELLEALENRDGSKAVGTEGAREV